MRCKPVTQTVIPFTVALCFFCPGNANSQNAFEKALTKKVESFFTPAVGTAAVTTAGLYPNDAVQTVMTPIGWGGYGTAVFGSIGGAYPEVYKTKKADLISSVGICTGNPDRLVNFAVSFNMADVHKLKDFSGNIVVSRSLGHGSSLSVGGLQLFTKAPFTDAPGSTFYLAFSHALQTILSKTTGCSKLGYTIGIGTGRFLRKSPKDIKAGKGKYGTAVFGSISYELFKHVNANAEWSGMNLGFSLGIRPFKNSLSIGIGVTNLTSYSADKPNMVFIIGYPLFLNKK